MKSLSALPIQAQRKLANKITAYATVVFAALAITYFCKSWIIALANGTF